MAEPKPRITRPQLAKELGRSVRTIDRWDALRIGPPRCKVRNLILYRREAVEEWLTKNELGPVR